MPTPLHYDLDWLEDNHQVIDENNLEEHLDSLDAAKHGRGLVPRDFKAKPPGCYSFAPLYPQSLILDPSKYADYFAKQQSGELPNLWNIREANYETLKSYDQNGYGLCWAFSSTKAATYLRVLAGLPGARLAPYYVAGEVKGWRDEGGNGDESLAFISQNGVPQESFCPNYRGSNATPQAAANAAMNKIMGWYDGSNDCQATVTSAGLLGYPGTGDFDDLGHSMALCYIVSLNPLVTAWDNSWSDISDYGPKGIYILKGRLAVPNNFFVAVGIEASQT